MKWRSIGNFCTVSTMCGHPNDTHSASFGPPYRSWPCPHRIATMHILPALRPSSGIELFAATALLLSVALRYGAGSCEEGNCKSKFHFVERSLNPNLVNDLTVATFPALIMWRGPFCIMFTSPFSFLVSPPLPVTFLTLFSHTFHSFSLLTRSTFSFFPFIFYFFPLLHFIFSLSFFSFYFLFFSLLYYMLRNLVATNYRNCVE